MKNNPSLTPSRLAKRGSQDLTIIKDILNAIPVCTIAYTHDGQTYSLPTGFVLYKDQLMIHGSVKSRFLEQMMGQKVCISCFELNALVLAASAFHHSMNYRSVVIFSEPQEVKEPEQKMDILEAFTEKLIPGRWSALRPVTEGELQATKVLAFSLDESSCKIRSGGPSDEKEDENFPVWTGILPVSVSYKTPQAAWGKESDPLPDHVVQAITTP
jgi:nitroimidazol reductase NimA-like FMN-containing flavoprotein (pyridoxamine 5'-phosphate oxidase superfamily)